MFTLCAALQSFSFQGKGGPYCEFRVRVQADRTTLLESVKNPLQFITIGPDGSPGEVRGILDKEPTRRFYVYAKVSVWRIMHYVNVSVLIKFSQTTSVFTLIIISSP